MFFLPFFAARGARYALRRGPALPHLFLFPPMRALLTPPHGLATGPRLSLALQLLLPTHRRLLFFAGIFSSHPPAVAHVKPRRAHTPRARACGSFAGGALFWELWHILYTTNNPEVGKSAAGLWRWPGLRGRLCVVRCAVCGRILRAVRNCTAHVYGGFGGGVRCAARRSAHAGLK